MSQPKLIVILGPTASGKSQLALHIAESLNGEIINADSRQFYRELNKATAKPTQEDQKRIVHHLVDCASICESWDMARFVRRAQDAIDQILAKGKQPIVAGGTGLYVKALLFGVDDIPAIDPEIRSKLAERLAQEGIEVLYKELQKQDPEGAERLAAGDTQRILRALEVKEQTGQPLHTFWKGPQESLYDYLKLALDWPREALYQRIDHRVTLMMQDGLLEEAQSLWRQYPENALLRKTIGYREWGEWGFEDVESVQSEIQKNTRHFAKRQLTWFRKEGDINWFDPTDSQSLHQMAIDFCQ